MNASTTEDLISVANAPDIPGLRFRRFGGKADYPAMAELVNICNAADQIDEIESAEELEAYYEHLTNCDLDKDIVMAEVDGQLIAQSRVRWRDELGGPLVYQSFAHLHPDWRRKGIGTAMLRHNEARMRQIAAGHDPERAKIFRSFASDTGIGNLALLKQEDYQPERFFFDMKRDLSEPIPDSEMPDGLEIRPASETQMRQVWEALDEAFRDHWGYSPGTEEDYERWRAFPHHDPEIWKVAWDGDQVAGMVLNLIISQENEELNRKWGWTDPICVRRPWRNRGLATALILESLKELKARGMEYAALGVDTENPSGALNLYERAGYQTYKRFESHSKPLN